jgi:hypothetical protein
MSKKKTVDNIELKDVSINKIQEFTDFRHVEINGLNLKADKCVLYDNCGIGIYFKGERLAFIECKNFEVINFGEFHTTIRYNSHKGQFSCSYIYLRYKEIGEDEDSEEEKENNFIKEVLNIGDKVIRNYNEEHSPTNHPEKKYSDSYLITNAYWGKKNLILEHLDDVRHDFEWELVEMIDGVIGRVKKNRVEELCLLKDIETLDTLLHNTEELIKALGHKKNRKE